MNLYNVLFFVIVISFVSRNIPLGLFCGAAYVAYVQWNIRYNAIKGSWFWLRKGRKQTRSHFTSQADYNAHVDEVKKDKFRFMEAHIPFFGDFTSEDHLVHYLVAHKESAPCPNCGVKGQMVGNIDRTYRKIVIETVDGQYLDTIWSVETDIVSSYQYTCGNGKRMASRIAMSGPSWLTDISMYRAQQVHCNCCNYSMKKDPKSNYIRKWIGPIDEVPEEDNEPVESESTFGNVLSFLFKAFSWFIIIFAAMTLLKKKDE